MNLAYKYPIVYWNAANLIVDSGGIQTIDYEEAEDEMIEVEMEEDEDEIIEENEEDDEVEVWEKANITESNGVEDKKKKKEKNIDYGKIASTIGKLMGYGIKISPPDINESSFTFTPIPKDNVILYGLRGIAGIAGEKIEKIISGRPYSSLNDFLSKNKLNVVQLSNLIKSGAFDNIESKPREQIMKEFLMSIADKKDRLTLQNMAMLISKDLIPEEMSFYGKLFSFNKFLKSCKENEYYKLNSAAIGFISKNFDVDIIINGSLIKQTVWDNVYKKAMEPMRQYLKDNKNVILEKLNQSLYDEVANKYGGGNISKWEMDSISFYYHEHELIKAANDYDDFSKLPEQPEIDYTFTTAGGQEVKMYKLHKIIGTVIDKDKMHNTITLLTPTGVVLVKIYKNQYSIYDKQLSQKGEDGKKHVIEASWFKRGTKLMIQGIRREDNFIPKKTKSSVFPIISKITNIDKYGNLTFQYDRAEVE